MWYIWRVFYFSFAQIFSLIYIVPVSYSLTHLASFVGMACKTWLHSFSFVPILHRRSSTLPAMSHLLNRSSQSGRLFSSFANRPSPTPVHAQAKRGFSSKNDDVAVASRKRAHTLSLSLSLSKYWTWWSSESDFVINYYWICSFCCCCCCCCCCLFWISWGCSVWSAIENSGISRPYSESEEQANRFVRR